MFEPGQRVVVIASSLKKNQIGPRKGSIGYMCGFAETNNFSTGITGETVFTSLQNVVFTKYGFEKKSRCEAKSIITILPTFTTEKRYEDLVKNINQKNIILRLQEFIYKHESFPVCLVAPYRIANLEDDNEFNCWLESHIKSIDMQNVVDEMYGHKKNHNINVEKAVLEKLYYVMFEGSTKARIKLMGYPKLMVIDSIRRIYYTYSKRLLKGTALQHPNNFLGLGGADIQAYNQVFKNYILTEMFDKMIKIQKEVIKNGNIDPEFEVALHKIMKNLSDTRSYVKSLARQIINE